MPRIDEFADAAEESEDITPDPTAVIMAAVADCLLAGMHEAADQVTAAILTSTAMRSGCDLAFATKTAIRTYRNIITALNTMDGAVAGVENEEKEG